MLRSVRAMRRKSGTLSVLVYNNRNQQRRHRRIHAQRGHITAEPRKLVFQSVPVSIVAACAAENNRDAESRKTCRRIRHTSAVSEFYIRCGQRNGFAARGLLCGAERQNQICANIAETENRLLLHTPVASSLILICIIA